MNEGAWFDDPPVRSREVAVERGVASRMRDGTVLLAGPANWLVATQTVLHGGAQPSRLVLPVLAT